VELSNFDKAAPGCRTPKRRSFVLAILVVGFCLATNVGGSNVISQLQPGSLCERDEKIVFSCTITKPSKIVSLCSSKELTKDTGYMRYRFGLPGKIELEYPKEQKLARDAFKYTHYFRYQVDYTTISFTLSGHKYMVWDDYNGEEKHNAEGLTVTPPGGKEVTMKCRGRAKAQYGDLPDAFPDHKDFPGQ
jgi:hypothetical protein